MTWTCPSLEAVIEYECCVDDNRLTVAKQGPNKGRQFYACAQPKGQGCNYFVWANDDPHQQNGEQRSQQCNVEK